MHRQTQREKRENERKRPVEEDPEFQIAPMIDILLVLLVFFMTISSTEVLKPNRSVQLPVAADAQAAKKNSGQIVINITWAAVNNLGAIEVDEKPYPQPESIIPILQKALVANPIVRVLIRADKSVNYEYLRSVLKVVGDAGISNVTFAVVDKEVAAKGK